jgi:hypothetical protein
MVDFLEHRPEKWKPFFGRIRCDNKYGRGKDHLSMTVAIRFVDHRGAHSVMVGLVPTSHVFACQRTVLKTWMLAARASMTPETRSFAAILGQ